MGQVFMVHITLGIFLIAPIDQQILRLVARPGVPIRAQVPPRETCPARLIWGGSCQCLQLLQLPSRVRHHHLTWPWCVGSSSRPTPQRRSDFDPRGNVPTQCEIRARGEKRRQGKRWSWLVGLSRSYDRRVRDRRQVCNRTRQLSIKSDVSEKCWSIR